MTEEKIAKKARAHTIYKLRNGTRVPGCTTITDVMGKPALVRWANGLGLQGIDSTKYVDETAQIGKLGHYLIECHLTDKQPEIGDYTANQIVCAEKILKRFIGWEVDRGLTLSDYALSEAALVSEIHRFGGTVDICAVVGGKACLIDIKTCKAIYGEHKTQVAGGYALLCAENGYTLDAVTILRIGRTEEEGFEEILVSPAEIELHQKRFLICRDLYEINKEIGR